MKILITGGAGFIGSHLADALIEKGHAVAIIDDLSTGNKENVNPKAVFYEADIRDEEKMKEVFEKERPEIVFHFAAKTSVSESFKSPEEYEKVNVMATITNVLENGKKYHVKRTIFASTGGAMYGENSDLPTKETHPSLPLSPYGANKLAAERSFENSGLPFVALRFANVYGPRQSTKTEAGVVAIFCEAMLAGKQPVIYGDGENTRDFVYVDDVIGACILAFEGKETGIFNIGTGKEININTVFEIIKKETGFKGEKKYGPVRGGEQRRSCLDSSKFSATFNWQSKYTLEDGIKKTVQYYAHESKL